MARLSSRVQLNVSLVTLLRIRNSAWSSHDTIDVSRNRFGKYCTAGFQQPPLDNFRARCNPRGQLFERVVIRNQWAGVTGDHGDTL